jgi:hypothetical protein
MIEQTEDLTIDGESVITGDSYGIDVTPDDAENGVWVADKITSPVAPVLTPEQLAWLQHKIALRAARAPKGKFAFLASAVQRLSGRQPTERELERQARKAFKKQQKRMELLTKSHYPTPKKKASRRMF